MRLAECGVYKGVPLDFDFGLANDRLRLAMEASASVGWDFRYQTRTECYVRRPAHHLWNPLRCPGNDLVFTLYYVHPDDRTRVWAAIDDARYSLPAVRDTPPCRATEWDSSLARSARQILLCKERQPPAMARRVSGYHGAQTGGRSLFRMNRRVIEAEELGTRPDSEGPSRKCRVSCFSDHRQLRSRSSSRMNSPVRMFGNFSTA